MRIKRLSIKNFMGARATEIVPHAPVTLIAGANGAGKSSILESLRAAMLGDVERVKLKKEYGALVSEGEKTGTVLIEHSAGRCAMTLPNGKHEAEGDTLHPAMPFVLDARIFATMDDKARRAVLFDLLEVKTDAKTLADRLVVEMGCSPERVKVIAPMLASGFEAAGKRAKDEATQARGAWRAVTGETYGSDKGANWRAEAVAAVEPEQIDAATVKAAQADQQHAEAMRALGAIESEAKQYAAALSKREALQAQADKIDRIREKLDRDTAEHTLWKGKLDELPPAPGAAAVRPPLACPDCGSMLTLHEGRLHAHTPNQAEDPETAVKRAQWVKAVELYAGSVTTGQRDLLNAERAKVELAEIDALPPVQDGAVTAAREAVAAAMIVRKEAVAAAAALRDQDAAAIQSERRTTAAAGHHTDVVEWSAIADALSFEGLPARILAAALDPFNRTLAEFAIGAEWRPVAIGADMGITLGGREYRLLCESEKWRADTMIAVAIAHFSGLKFVALDRFDVLDTARRGQFLWWLNDLAGAGTLDQVIVAGTLKARPTGLPDHIDAVWIEGGYVVPAEVLEAA